VGAACRLENVARIFAGCHIGGRLRLQNFQELGILCADVTLVEIPKAVQQKLAESTTYLHHCIAQSAGLRESLQYGKDPQMSDRFIGRPLVRRFYVVTTMRCYLDLMRRQSDFSSMFKMSSSTGAGDLTRYFVPIFLFQDMILNDGCSNFFLAHSIPEKP
jgi:hypothetical protein